ncbi:MAG: hypothetical protein ACXACX_21750 [Candidatus Hodarchaeales archaeon]|jgi:ribosomal protein L18
MNGKEKDKAKKDLDEEVEDFINHESSARPYDIGERKNVYSAKKIGKEFAEASKKKKVKK